MPILPAGHRVLVAPDPSEERTASGLFIPAGTQAQEAQAQIFGRVVAVGPTAWKAFDSGQPWAEVNDRVAFAKYGGFIIKDPISGEEFRLLNDEDICAVIKEA